jgi:sugar transferase (PEP-CTERM/EpsH1 system associated)
MRIFFLVSRFPFPLEKGDKLRAFNQLKTLSKNHEIYLCCLTDEPISEAQITAVKPYCKEIKIFKLSRFFIFLNTVKAVFSALPFQVHYFYQAHIHKQLKNYILKVKPNHIYCQLIRTSEYVKDIFDIPKTIDFMDCLSKGFERIYKLEKTPLKHIYRLESERLRQYEASIFPYFDYKTVISCQDQSFFIHPEKAKILVTPNGVDLNVFSPKVQPEKKYTLGFIGNLGYSPNLDSAFYLIEHILPLISKEISDVSLVIAGASPPASLMAKSKGNVHILSNPEDITEIYAQCSIFVAPIRLGSGMQNKLLEAMAMRIPCVCSPQAANAFENLPKEALLTAETPEDFTKQVTLLHKNKDFSAEITKSAFSYVKNFHNWENTLQVLEDKWQEEITG